MHLTTHHAAGALLYSGCETRNHVITFRDVNVTYFASMQSMHCFRHSRQVSLRAILMIWLFPMLEACEKVFEELSVEFYHADNDHESIPTVSSRHCRVPDYFRPSLR